MRISMLRIDHTYTPIKARANKSKWYNIETFRARRRYLHYAACGV